MSETINKKNIIIGVSGSIAAYKACELIRLFSKAGHHVKVVLTENAKKFVGKMTFSALTNDETYDDVFSDPMLHISLAKWADEIVIAPASASLLSRLATGAANDLLTTVCLATQARITIVPAMNTVMWENVATQKNISILQNYGHQFIMPDTGIQACGDIGYGRMVEPVIIAEKFIHASHILENKTVLITVGATREKLDPIRYISNFSSGKMGFALAQACQQAGAEVILIAGLTSTAPPKNCELIPVESSDDMVSAVHEHLDSTDIIISAAAIADYKPKVTAPQKIKKSKNVQTIELVKTQDLLLSIKDKKLFKVGFCAETENLVEYAKQKLETKCLDAIIANQVSEEGHPFGADENEVFYLNKQGDIKHFSKTSKLILAQQLIELIAQEL